MLGLQGNLMLMQSNVRVFIIYNAMDARRVSVTRSSYRARALRAGGGAQDGVPRYRLNTCKVAWQPLPGTCC
jgi:hypothetical protein